MTRTRSLKEYLKLLLAEGKLEDALIHIKQRGNSVNQSEAILTLSRLRGIHRDLGFGLLSFADYIVERTKIARAIQSLIDDISEKDSIEIDSDESDRMSWDIWSNQIQFLIELLEYMRKSNQPGKHFQPDAIIGITNGGLTVMDMVARQLYSPQNIPVLALWARRESVEKDKENGKNWPISYFTHEYNEAQIKILKRRKERKRKLFSILLIDDLVKSSTTYFQAKKYLIEKLGRENLELLFIPLFIYKKEYLLNQELDNAEKELLYGFRNGIYGLQKEAFFEKFITDYKILPWGKRIDDRDINSHFKK